jgi:hypothetical protein
LAGKQAGDIGFFRFNDAGLGRRRVGLYLLTRQAGFIVTVYDEDGLRLAATMPCSTPAEAFVEARKIVDNKVEGPRK